MAGWVDCLWMVIVFGLVACVCIVDGFGHLYWCWGFFSCCVWLLGLRFFSFRCGFGVDMFVCRGLNHV